MKEMMDKANQYVEKWDVSFYYFWVVKYRFAWP